MGYKLKITLEDGKVAFVIPEGVNRNSLVSFDNYVSKKGSNFFLFADLKKEFALNQNIKNVKIADTRTEIEYSIINNNKYLTPVLETVKKKNVQLSGEPYTRNTDTVDVNNSTFIEMKEYLFKQLKENINFLDEIYTNKNTFSMILNKYIIAINNNHNEEDNRNVNLLESEIIKALSIYKNYRSMCVARYFYEKNLHVKHQSNSTVKNVQINTNVKKNDEVDNQEKRKNYSIDSELSKGYQYYGEDGEKEEFLDEDDKRYGSI